METIELALDKIIPYEFNNKIHSEQQINRIANSISEFGFNQPLVLDENNIILVGHGRFEASKKLNLNTVPCIIKTNLSEAQKKAYRILDNKLSNDSPWDTQALELELATLEEMGTDITIYGLDELKALFPKDENEVFNSELDPSEIKNDLVELKIKLSQENYDLVFTKLKEENEDLGIALISLLGL